MRQEVYKERVLPTLRFTESKEVGHLSGLKRDEGPKGVMCPTSPEKLTRRKWARTRMGRKCTKDQCAKQLNATHQPNRANRTSRGIQAIQACEDTKATGTFFD